MTSYLTSMDTISLSRTVLEIMPVKILKAEQNGGVWPFKRQGQESIFFYLRKGTSSHQTASFEILRMKTGSAVSPKSVKRFLKHKPLYVGYMYLSPWKFFRTQISLDFLGRWRYQSCRIFFESVHSGVSGKGSNFAIFSANRIQMANTTVVLPYTLQLRFKSWDFKWTGPTSYSLACLASIRPQQYGCYLWLSNLYAIMHSPGDILNGCIKG